jgi:hypothetical protein
VPLVILPKRLGPDPKVPPDGRLVPKDTICYSVRLGCIIQYQALIVFGTRIHNLTKLIKVGKYAKKSFIEILAVLTDVITERKDIVHVGSDHRGHVHTVLGRHHKEYLPVAAIHKELADRRVSHKGSIVHTVIHKDKDGATPSNRQELLLTLYEFLKGILVIVAKDKEIRNELLIVPVSFLGS